MSDDLKFEPLQSNTLALMHGDYAHAIDRIEEDESITQFEYLIPRHVVIQEIKRMESWILEHDLTGAGNIPTP